MSVHLFLSPHLDDAILSCGGLIHRLGQSGERVIVVTAMAGEPQNPLPESPVLQSIRDRWTVEITLVSERRAEDIQAAQQVYAQIYHMPLMESIFRTSLSGTGERIALYPHHDSPFQGVSRADEAALTLLDTRLPFTEVSTIYAPLCVDEHVDHQLVRDWALVLTGSHNAPALCFYEEFPQSRNKTAVQKAHAFYHRQLPALSMVSEIALLTNEDIAAKLRAMRCYHSHLHILWNDEAEMEQLAREYMIAVGTGTPAERYWRVIR